MARVLLISIIIFMISCKAKTPYNPYLKAKDKPSASITDERKKMEKGALKKNKRRLRKNRKQVYSN